MAKHGKNYISTSEKIKKDQLFSIEQSLSRVKELAYAKFDESVDVDINLGIDPSKGDQVVRGSVLLPYGSGKETKVLVFAKGDHAQQAKDAGADYVGAEDLIERIESGWMGFNYAVATPDLMGKVGKLAKTLGPRGLLPNKKVGTVTFDVANIVTDLKKGRSFFKNDKSGLIHFSIGKVSFDKDKLLQNFTAFIKALITAKPPTSKGKYLKKMVISSTMGIGIPVNADEVLKL